jgi:hypothetical protein
VRYGPPKFAHRPAHDLLEYGFIRGSVLFEVRSFSTFSLSMFGHFRHSVIRCSVPFEVRSFDILSFDVRSHSTFSLSTFGPIRGSVFRCSVLFDVRSFEVRSFDVQSFEVRSFEVRSFEVQSRILPLLLKGQCHQIRMALKWGSFKGLS